MTHEAAWNVHCAIESTITKTYGDNGMSRALVAHLAEKIASFEPRHKRDTRQDMVMRTCWDWFSGGSTAASVADKIETALKGEIDGD